MRFAVVGEGLTDHIVLKNLLMGFFSNKNLIVNRLRPIAKEPGGWGNVLAYLSSEEFKDSFEYNDFVIIQIDTRECEEWADGTKNIGADSKQLNIFINQVKTKLTNKIDAELFDTQKGKIIFAICVHEIECWLLPFNTAQKAHVKKIVGCFGTLEDICTPRGFSINKKHYQEGKYYDVLSEYMKDNKLLMKKSKLNPGLTMFIESLSLLFPQNSVE